MKVLLVEDDRKIASAVQRGLAAEGFTVEVAADGLEGRWLATEGGYDLVILDLMLPGRNGFQVCADLRDAGDWTPILMLTAKDGELDEAEALDTGADDYLTKPFSFPVLVARVRALLRRGAGGAPAPVTVGDLRIDPAAGAGVAGRRRGAPDDAASSTCSSSSCAGPGRCCPRARSSPACGSSTSTATPTSSRCTSRRLRRKLDEPFGRRHDHDRARRRLPAGRDVKLVPDDGPRPASRSPPTVAARRRPRRRRAGARRQPSARSLTDNLDEQLAADRRRQRCRRRSARPAARCRRRSTRSSATQRLGRCQVVGADRHRRWPRPRRDPMTTPMRRPRADAVGHTDVRTAMVVTSPRRPTTSPRASPRCGGRCSSPSRSRRRRSAVLTWVLVGRTLRPVERIRAEVAEIGGSRPASSGPGARRRRRGRPAGDDDERHARPRRGGGSSGSGASSPMRRTSCAAR